MSKTPPWYEDFFSGASLDLWRHAKSLEETEDECAFLEDVLGLEEGAHLLDLPCGNGRLSVPMAQSGFKITGIDFCQEFLNEAKRSAADAGLSEKRVSFIHGDMRSLSLTQKFDASFCMGNSFGYFDRAGTGEYLQSISESLKPGAKFVIDTLMSAESFLVNGGEREWIKVTDMYMLVENQYDCRHGCVRTEYTFVRDGKQEQRQALHWIFTAGEICSMLEQTGFEICDLFGSIDCQSFVLGSERLLLVASKH